MTKKFADFKNARKFARSLKLKSIKEWQFFSKNHRPNNIPSSPARSYVEKGWISWGDFLGTGNIAIKLRVFRDFEDARKFARSLKLKNYEEWREYCKTKNKPNDIPTHPNEIYKKRWKGVDDFLGTGNIAIKLRVFRDFEDARKFARSLKLKNYEEWREYCKTKNKPNDIPIRPQIVYKNRGWINMKDWLGNKK